MSALELLQRWPVPPRAAGVLVIADLATGEPADHASSSRVELVETFGDLDVVCDWASVTKLLVALAVLVEAESERLALADPCGPPGSTVRHLLAHASGLGPDLPEPLSAPGVRRIYSNIGFELLGELVSERCARRWQDVVADAVTRPIGMHRTGVVAGGSAASGAAGSVSDLLALGRELLSPTIISRTGLDSATSMSHFLGCPVWCPASGDSRTVTGDSDWRSRDPNNLTGLPHLLAEDVRTLRTIGRVPLGRS